MKIQQARGESKLNYWYQQKVRHINSYEFAGFGVTCGLDAALGEWLKNRVKKLLFGKIKAVRMHLLAVACLGHERKDEVELRSGKRKTVFIGSCKKNNTKARRCSLG